MPARRSSIFGAAPRGVDCDRSPVVHLAARGCTSDQDARSAASMSPPPDSGEHHERAAGERAVPVTNSPPGLMQLPKEINEFIVC